MLNETFCKMGYLVTHCHSLSTTLSINPNWLRPKSRVSIKECLYEAIHNYTNQLNWIQ